MALEAKLSQKLSQQLVMTPQLRQAIKILQVSRTELDTLVDSELTENPVLEEGGTLERSALEPAVPEAPRTDGVVAEADQAPAAAETADPGAVKDLKEIDWRDYFEKYG